MAELMLQLGEMWACLTCYGKFESGELPSASFACPHCHSRYIHPIYRGPIALLEYDGVITSRN